MSEQGNNAAFQPEHQQIIFRRVATMVVSVVSAFEDIVHQARFGDQADILNSEAQVPKATK